MDLSSNQQCTLHREIHPFNQIRHSNKTLVHCYISAFRRVEVPLGWIGVTAENKRQPIPFETETDWTVKSMKGRNVTKDDIRVRQIVFNENVWTAPIVNKGEVDTSLRKTESEFIKSGRADMGDIIKQIYERANDIYGTDFKPGF